MGICLDTEREQNGSQEFEVQGREAWLSDNEGNFRYANTPPEGQFPMQNGSHVKFEVPRVPVIFVLGGPGSGKVTHCDTLMQEKRGITHINMTDLLHQYTMGEGEMKDYGKLSSKTVTEVLMLEMKMSPAAKTYLISGYPRNMRDVVEYSSKIQIVNGVILIAWREKVLERQIDYGAKLGHVVLSMARMELNNFFKHVIPVADYFDQRGMLMAVNGERNPSEVYSDFRTAVLRILGTVDKEGVVTNGVAVQPVPATAISVYKPPNKGYPPVIWVIGGPGSNKSSLCQKVVRQAPGWVHLSLGRLLRAAAEADQAETDDSEGIRHAVSVGQMVDRTVVMQIVETQMSTNMNAQGILLDGFPRDMTQVHEFEDKFLQQPNIILLDCSKLQLGRGRMDDSIAAFRRRLELFRELTLPMLKTLDNENRLTIVDGDTETPQVYDEFAKIVLQQVEHLRKVDGMIVPEQHPVTANGNAQQPAANGDADTYIHDLEDDEEENVGGPVNAVHMNGYGPPGISDISKTVAAYQQNNEMNGGLFGGPTLSNRRTSRDTIRNMYAQVERLDSNM